MAFPDYVTMIVIRLDTYITQGVTSSKNDYR